MSRDNRKPTKAREISIETNVNLHAEGSVLVKFGNTHVICTASIDNNVPRWMKGSDKGWVTAEYGMLPRSTNERMGREAARGKQSGRTQEIQRLIGRSLRQSVNLKYLKDKTIQVDCDVIQADGGTRAGSGPACRPGPTRRRHRRRLPRQDRYCWCHTRAGRCDDGTPSGVRHA